MNANQIYSLSIVIWEMVARIVTGVYSRPFSEYQHLSVDFQIIIQVRTGSRKRKQDCCWFTVDRLPNPIYARHSLTESLRKRWST